MRTKLALYWAASLIAFALTTSVHGQSAAFTYQGQLTENGSPAAGIYDLRFVIYDLAAGGAEVGGPITNAATAVSNGLFSVSLDFGASVFDGGARWLQIGIATNGSGVFNTLNPRHQITSTPYAITAGNVPAGGLSGTYVGAVNFSNASNAFVGDGSGLSGINSLDAADGFPVDAVFVDGAGNVGIGTSSPSSMLHLVNSGPDIAIKLRTAGSWTAELRQTDSSILSLINGGTERLTVTPNGRFGFNTTTPSAALHVVSDLDPGLRLEAVSDSGQDTGMAIVGSRNGSTTVDAAFIDLKDFDSDEGSGEEFTMARIGAGMADPAGKTGFLRFYTGDGSGPVERMTITKNGNVGIGTSSLSEKLEVAGDVAIGGGTTLGQEDGGSENLRIRGYLDDWYLGVVNTNNINATSFFLGLNDADYNRFHFTRSGDLGIGTIPTSDLHLAGTGSLRLHLEADTDNSGEADQPSVLLTQDGGVVRLEMGFFDSNNSPSIRTLDSGGGVANLLLEPEGRVGVGSAAPQALLDVQGTGATAGGISGFGEVVGHYLQTSASTHSALSIDALTNQDAILYFAEDGNATWGLRSDADDPSWVVPLFNLRYHNGGVNETAIRVVPVGGSTRFYVQPGQDDTVSLGTSPNSFEGRAFHDVVSYNISNVSDRRSKRDIQNLDYGIEELMMLRPVRFRWKARPDDGESLGVIAQEVQEIIPEAVSGNNGDPESYLGVRYAEIVPVLIRGIQDQQRQIDQLQTKNDQLVSRLKALEALVNSGASRTP